jgi:hypothetical protein
LKIQEIIPPPDKPPVPLQKTSQLKSSTADHLIEIPETPVLLHLAFIQQEFFLAL